MGPTSDRKKVVQINQDLYVRTASNLYFLLTSFEFFMIQFKWLELIKDLKFLCFWVGSSVEIVSRVLRGFELDLFATKKIKMGKESERF